LATEDESYVSQARFIMCAAGEILGAFLVPAATKYSRKSWVFDRLAPFGRENTLKKLGSGALMVPPALRKM
jgi:hypothetical protein